jgi:membrane-associated phospholipid phosphatase
VVSAAWVVSVALTLQQTPPPQRAPAPAERPITRLVQNLRDDLLQLPRPESIAIFAAAGASAIVASNNADARLSTWALQNGNALSYTPIGQVFGNEWLQGGAALATYTIGAVQHSPEIAHIGSDLIRAQVLNGVMTVSLKLVTERTRPDGGSLSFPSGHSSATFASATVLANHYGWKVGVPAFAVASFTSWTRVRDRQHWLSDVVFGSAIGVVAGHTVTLGHGPGAWSVVPVAAPGGAGLYFVKK